MKTLLIDAFPFFQEVELLKVRLEYLGDVVDKFLISESNIDFSANPKDFVLTNEILRQLPYSHKVQICRNNFSRFETKFIYSLAKKIKWRKPFWNIQKRQRNSLGKTISKIEQPGVLLFGDLDEFPNKSDLEKLTSLALENPDSFYTFNQLPLVYNLTTQSRNDDWPGTVACSISTAKTVTLNKIRKMRSLKNPIGTGWHFSYFGNITQIKRKVRSLSTSEKLFDFQKTSDTEIVNRISNNQDPFEVSNVRRNSVSLCQFPNELLNAFQAHFPDALND